MIVILFNDMAKSVYAAKTYRDFIQSKIKSADDNWGLITKMAEAAHCQRSQLSRVLSSHIHLTLDQAYGLCEFWALNEDETNFFLNLVEYERAGTKRYKEKLGREIQRERKRQDDLATRLKHPPVGPDQIQNTYYSAWYWSAIHILISIPEFATVSKISERLNIPTSLVEHCLSSLKEWGLATVQNGRWRFSAQTSHLSRLSPMISLHHSNWRQRAVLDSQMQNDESIHFTIAQSVSAKDVIKLRELVLQTIDEYNRMAGPSEPEELICFSCDLFKV